MIGYRWPMHAPFLATPNAPFDACPDEEWEDFEDTGITDEAPYFGHTKIRTDILLPIGCLHHVRGLSLGWSTLCVLCAESK